MRHYWHYGHHHSAWAWIVPSITMLLLLLALIGLLVLLWRTLSHRTPTTPARWPGTTPPPGHAATQPEQLLAERLARGEIDIDDYRQRLAALRGDPDKGP